MSKIICIFIASSRYTTVHLTEHESKVEEAEEKLVAAREEAALQETQARVLVAEMTRASSQLAAAEKRTKEQSDRIADLQRRLRSAESELSERDFDATELRAAAAEKQALLQQRTLQVQCLEQQFKTFRVNMEQQALQLNQHLEGAVQKERAKDTQIQELQRHLDASQLETRDVAARLGEARQKSEVDGAAICKLVSDLERIVAFQKDEVATLTRELDAKTRAVAAETDTWRDSERQVRERLHEASVKLEHVEERESTLRTELQQLANIYNRKEADAERMTDEIGALRVREASLATELEQQQRELQQQRTQHQSQVASLQTELRRCGDESRESRDAASRDIRQRENKLQALMTQLNDCQRQLHEARVTIHSQESRNRHLSGQLRTYEDGQYLFSPEQALLQHRTSSVYDEPDTPTKSMSNHSSKAEDRNKIFDYRVKEIDESGSRRVSIAGGSTGENRDESQTFQGMLDKVLLEIDGHHHTSHNHTASYPAQRDTDSNSSYSVHPN
ncbi:PREDICTED: paramyosin-like [Priapulus caudatus]|uniref:Paramyosin-like n=1 Tax=Priapulus caudatus TaxID=37621 RepID=A0ABM1EQP4_PRICU|nr:PREDICTED: paramyosin-like [Priapulus caudatus]